MVVLQTGAGVTGFCGPQPDGHAAQLAAVHTLLCYRKLVCHRFGYCFAVFMWLFIADSTNGVNTHCGYTFSCSLDTMRHSPHLCVRFGVAKIRRPTRTRKCSYQGDGNHHHERSCAAIRLQVVLSGAWAKDQTTPQGERADAPCFDRSTRLSFDPDTADRKGRRDLDPDAAAHLRNFPDSIGEVAGRCGVGGEHRRAVVAVGEVSTLATPACTTRKPTGEPKSMFGIYYLSAVSGTFCDIPSSLFFR